MNLNESFRIAINSLRINQMRALLTGLGIIIGVASVIALVNLGRGVEAYVQNQFGDLGSDVLTVVSQQPESDAIAVIQPLTVAEAEALANPAIAPHVKTVVQQYDVAGVVRYNSESVSLQINGVSPNYATVNNWELSAGTFMTPEQNETGERVAVLGRATVEDLFGNADANVLGLFVDINGRLFEVIGVMGERSLTGFSDPNEAVLVPVRTAQTRLDNARVPGGTYELSQIQIVALDSDSVAAASEEVTNYLRNAHEIAFIGEEDFSVSDQGETLDSLSSITSILTIFLGLVAGVSLLVGGIGIMNIMLVSVSERTREIGLRKAVGAQRNDILLQFLIESLLLSVVGGIVGIVFGALILVIAAVAVPDLPLTMTWDSVALATGVSTFIGVFFGFYPANRAAAMTPIQALRSE